MREHIAGNAAREWKVIKMPEYITKEQAIDEVWDAFTSRDDPDLGRVIEENIERLPAADVVEVVRCKDCADFRPWGGQSKLGNCMVYVCDGENPFTMEETDFCSDGERRS